MPRFRSTSLLAALVLSASSLAAQTRVTVNGLAYDSLRSAPLAGALVAITGTSHSTITDSVGRFRFVGVTPGTLTFTLQHDALDSAGFSGLSRKIVVTDGRADVRIAVPSFGTLWRAACGLRPESADSGFVFGTVRDALTSRPVPNAHVEISWVDLTAGKGTNVSQKRYRVETESDTRGGYGVCGVPMSAAARARATTTDRASGTIDLPSHSLRMLRMDVVVGPTDSLPSHTGVVAGTVLGGNGSPIAGARVTLEDMPEVRTSNAGRFVIRNVRAGTRQLEVLAIGMSPVLKIVEVTPNDTTQVAVEVKNVTTLKPVNVNAAARQSILTTQLNDRIRLGIGHFIDSTALRKATTLNSVFQGIPSVQLQAKNRQSSALDFIIMLPYKSGTCQANLFIDGHKAIPDQINMMRASDFAAIEVYARKNEAPLEFAASMSECGSVAFWTYNAFR